VRVTEFRRECSLAWLPENRTDCVCSSNCAAWLIVLSLQLGVRMYSMLTCSRTVSAVPEMYLTFIITHLTMSLPRHSQFESLCVQLCAFSCPLYLVDSVRLSVWSYVLCAVLSVVFVFVCVCALVCVFVVANVSGLHNRNKQLLVQIFTCKTSFNRSCFFQKPQERYGS